MNKLWKVAAAALLLGMAGLAQAAVRAQITDEVPLKAGPSSTYPTVAWLDAGAEANLQGCLRTRDWCEVRAETWDGWEWGWVPAYAVLRLDRYNRWGYQNDLFWSSLPLLTFDGWLYWDRRYRDHSWYRSDRGWFERTYPNWRYSTPFNRHRDWDRNERDRWHRRDGDWRRGGDRDGRRGGDWDGRHDRNDWNDRNDRDGRDRWDGNNRRDSDWRRDGDRDGRRDGDWNGRRDGDGRGGDRTDRTDARPDRRQDAVTVPEQRQPPPGFNSQPVPRDENVRRQGRDRGARDDRNTQQEQEQ